MVEENLENMLVNEGISVPNVWVELEGEFLEFDKDKETLKCKFPVREKYFNPLPTTLGGIIDSWIDITMGPLTVLLGQKAVNKNFSIKYLKPVGPSIEFVATPIMACAVTKRVCATPNRSKRALVLSSMKT